MAFQWLALQATILGFQLVRHVAGLRPCLRHTSAVGMPFGVALEPVAGSRLTLLLDHPDYLRLGETALPHSSAPSRLSRLYIRLRDLAGGRSKTIKAGLL
jgi:hypothetical protein